MSIPVILDTDIGSDIDDTWALAMMLRCPELDVRLIVSDSGNTEYRSRIIAKLLEIAGRTDIAVGIGLWQDDETGNQEDWVKDYDLKRYPGKVHADGVSAIIQTIRESKEPITLICIGPVPNIRLALAKAPDIAQRARFVGMHGSFDKNCDGRVGAIPEYNVIYDLKAAAKVFAAPWREAVITPLDTCGQVRLAGEHFRTLAQSSDPLVKAVIENYRIWAQKSGGDAAERLAKGESSILFDTVAIHLAYTTRYLKMERFGVAVDWQGYTRRSQSGRPFEVAMAWENLAAYKDELVRRLLGQIARQ
ncbi:MAG: nucleoside hydrolase [Planctomycetota bacterium]|nr:nucleoside hydrolase [Planctomycetota bacterium]